MGAEVEQVEGRLLIRGPAEVGVVFSQVEERSSDVGEALYEPSVEIDKT